MGLPGDVSGGGGNCTRERLYAGLVSSWVASFRSAHCSTSAAQLRHTTNLLGERPCPPRLDQHARTAIRWSSAAWRVAFLSSCARRSDDTEAVSAKHHAWPHLAVHVYLDRTLEMGATKMRAAIRCPLVGDSTRGTETAEPLTSTPASRGCTSRCIV
jgi:hypothetical protein